MKLIKIKRNDSGETIKKVNYRGYSVLIYAMHGEMDFLGFEIYDNYRNLEFQHKTDDMPQLTNINMVMDYAKKVIDKNVSKVWVKP